MKWAQGLTAEARTTHRGPCVLGVPPRFCALTAGREVGFDIRIFKKIGG
jgi:hypothetical protein